MNQKMKIRKSISKRLKVTKTGKILFRGSHVRHLSRKKSKSRLRRQRSFQELRGTYKKKVKKLLGK